MIKYKDKFKLSVLCQSPVIEGESPTKSLKNTIELSQLSDNLGYNRFWVSEHHNTKAFASASPEIMMSVIASKTSKIRVGSAGILIKHYSPLKVAEIINSLSAIYPNRIDFGVGRSTGADLITTQELSLNNINEFEKFNKTISFIKNENKKITASPLIKEYPEYWILGTSPQSALFAAINGLNYSFGSFINHEHFEKSAQEYFINFDYSKGMKPNLNLSLVVFCADSKKKANIMAKSSEDWFINNFLRKNDSEFKSRENIKDNYSLQEKMILEYRRSSCIIGTKDEVYSSLLSLKEKYQINEFTIVTITDSFDERVESYKLLADFII